MPAAAAPSATARHIRLHSRRAAVSRNGSLRSVACNSLTFSFTALSSIGFTSWARLSRKPMIDVLTSDSDTCAERLGSIRQAGRIVGRAVIVTVPRILPRWSSERSLPPPEPRREF